MISHNDQGLLLDVKLTPNAKVNEICDIRESVVYIKLNAQPVDGKANKALIDYLAKQFKTPKKDVLILKGLTSKNKRIQINNPRQYPDILKAYSTN